MSLSTDLISQFVKATKDQDESPKTTTVYGKVVKKDSVTYVQLDGSEGRLTPISPTTTDIEDGDRVSVTIRNHVAIITGNLTSPSARTDTVKVIDGKVEDNTKKINDFEIIIADKISVDELKAEIARIETLEADSATIKGKLEASEADIESLKTGKLDAAIANIDFAKVKDLEATNAEVYNFKSTYGEFADLTTDRLEATEADIDKLSTEKLSVADADIKYADIDDLDAANANITNLSGEFGVFKDLTANNFSAVNAEISELETKKLSAESADLKYANIDFTNIGKAAMGYFYAQSGLIKDVTVGDQTITGHLVGVTISGDLIEGNTIKAEKLVIKGSDGLYYKLNTDGMVTEAEQTDQNSLNGSIIRAKSITASKISVTDLVAFGATIGGFHITDNSIYSGSKVGISNTTRGIYFDNDGQFNFGDASNFVKFYKDSNGNYKLVIDADELMIGDSSTNVETAIGNAQSTANTAVQNAANAHDAANAATVKADNAQSTANTASTKADTAQSTADTARSEASAAQEAAEKAQSDIDNLSIGGRNLLRQSGHWTELPTWWTSNGGGCELDTTNKYLGHSTLKTTVGNGIVGNNYQFFELDPNKVYTYSAMIYSTEDYSGNQGVPLHYHCSADKTSNAAGVTTIAYDQSTVAGKWKLLYLTFKPNAKWFRPFIYIGAGTRVFNIAYLKLEEGNRATDWTPAPEDVDTEISSIETRVTAAETQITKNNEAIQLRATKTEVTDAKNAAIADTDNKLKNYSTTAQMNSALTVKANEITSHVSATYTTKEDFENLEVGGRNLWFKTKEYDASAYTGWVDNNAGSQLQTTAPYTTVNGFGVQRIASAWTDISQRVAIEPNTEYTLSAWIKWEGAAGTIMFYCNGASPGSYNVTSQVGTDTYKRVSFTFNSGTATVSTCRFECTDNTPYLIYGLKLEKGNKPTDWTPAPEDADARIESAETRITQTEKDILLRATTEEMNAAIKVAADGISSEVGSAKDDIESLKTKVPWITDVWLDATTYDESLWIPFVGDSLSASYSSRICVNASLSYNSTPSWGTHAGGFSVEFEVEDIGNGWGTNPWNTRILTDKFSHCSVSPVSYTQLGYSSKPVLYLRGGGKYRVRTSYDCTWWAYPNGYTWTSGQYSQSAPTHDSRPKPLGDSYAWQADMTEAKSKINQHSDSITAVVAKANQNETDIASLKLTNDAFEVRFGTVEDDVDTAIANAATAQSTANTAQSTANGVKTDLANNYTKKTLPDTRNDNQNPGWYITNYPQQIITEFKQTSVIGLSGPAYCTLTTTVPWPNTSGGLPTQVAKISNKEYWRVGTSETAWGAWNDAIGDAAAAQTTANNATTLATNAQTDADAAQTTANTASSKADTAQTKANSAYDLANTANTNAGNAAKTATNYMKFENNTGLIVGDMTKSTLGRNVLIDSDSIDIRNGTSVMASYRDNMILLGMNSPTSIIDLCNGTGQITSSALSDIDEWWKLDITSQNSIGLNTGIGELTADNYFETGWGDFARTTIRATASTPWTSDPGMYGLDARYNGMIYIASELNDTSAYGRNLQYIDMSAANGIVIAQESTPHGMDSQEAKIIIKSSSEPLEYEYSHIDLCAFYVNVDGWFRVLDDMYFTTNNSRIWGTETDGTQVEVFQAKNSSDNTVIGWGNYDNGKGNTNIYGNDVFLGSRASMLAGAYRPYYRGGDAFNIKISTSGFVTSSGSSVRFIVPLSKPIIGNPTITASSVNGLMLRQNGNYTHGSSASTYVSVSSYTVDTTNNGNHVVIFANLSTTTNVTNNDAIGVHWSGRLTLSFG